MRRALPRSGRANRRRSRSARIWRRTAGAYPLPIQRPQLTEHVATEGLDALLLHKRVVARRERLGDRMAFRVELADVFAVRCGVAFEQRDHAGELPCALPVCLGLRERLSLRRLDLAKVLVEPEHDAGP